jgi:hypothetical protein
MGVHGLLQGWLYLFFPDKLSEIKVKDENSVENEKYLQDVSGCIRSSTINVSHLSNLFSDSLLNNGIDILAQEVLISPPPPPPPPPTSPSRNAFLWENKY